MPREIKNFDLSEKEVNNEQSKTTRKKVVELEPSYFYDEEVPNLNGHSSIPEGVGLNKHVPGEENNVELSKFEKKLQDIGIIPSDAWISGPSKNLWVNLAKNFVTETFGIKKEEEFVESEWIIELPELDGVDELKPNYDEPVNEVKEDKVESPKHQSKKSTNEYEDLFYSDDNEDLDIAPSCCEVYK